MEEERWEEKEEEKVDGGGGGGGKRRRRGFPLELNLARKKVQQRRDGPTPTDREG